jgi:starch synthase
MNFLKAGIAFADAITTVSPRYAREILTPEFGCGLDGMLGSRRHLLTGILNGVDYDEWKTTGNPHLSHAYSRQNLEGKTSNKLDLQRSLGLVQRIDTPLFGSVTRLVDQKGVDLMADAVEAHIGSGMQFVMLGSGQPVFEAVFTHLAQRHPSQAAVRIGYDHSLSHRIEAGCDFFLMPSRFEPCGLNQMYSQRYGTIPIVRATGGLDDSVVDIRENPAKADGIKFHECSSAALTKAMQKAMTLFQDPDMLPFYRRNAMAADFSWHKTAAKYLDVYKRM